MLQVATLRLGQHPISFSINIVSTLYRKIVVLRGWSWLEGTRRKRYLKSSTHVSGTCTFELGQHVGRMVASVCMAYIAMTHVNQHHLPGLETI